MPLRQALTSDVHVAVVDDDVVFLDVQRDRYACLPGLASAARPDPERVALLVEGADLAKELRAAGLTSDTPITRRPWRAPSTPQASALSLRVERPRLRDVAEGGRAVADLWLSYRGRALADLLTAVRSTDSQTSETGAAGELTRIATRFRRWAPFAPTSAKCLLRAFMLLRLLQRQGHDAQWIFGVRTRPFEAHCWLQAGGLVLDDDVDRVAALEPILVI